MITDSETCAQEALFLYECYILQTGFTAPTSYEDLLLFVELSGGLVACHFDAPEDFGLQFADWIIVTGSPRTSDRARMLILAHEWCHWLRRSGRPKVLRFYDVSDEAEERDREERIAQVFARMF